MDYVIKGAFVVSPSIAAPLDIGIKNGKIEAIGFDIDCDNALYLNGAVIFPGFVDIHTHFELEVGEFTSADNFETGSRAAIAGGTTTVVDYITPSRGEKPADAFARWLNKAKNSIADYAFHFSMTAADTEYLNAVSQLADAGITGFKVFLAYPDRLMLSPDEIGKIMIEVKKAGGVLHVHTEDGQAIEKLRAKAISEGKTHPKWHYVTRPSETEGNAAKIILDLVRKHKCPTVIVHIASKEVIDVLQTAKKENLPLFGETCPQYLWLNNRFLDKSFEESAPFLCSPPLRSVDHADALWKALEREDIKFIATDHCPFMLKDRLKYNKFNKIPNGLPGVETRFPLIYSGGVYFGRMDLKQLTRHLSTYPALIAGLYPRKGTIKPGSDADFTIFDMNSHTSLSVEDLHGRADHSPYEDMIVPGRVFMVIKGGEIIYTDGEFHSPPKGNFIKREKLTDKLIKKLMKDRTL